MTLDLALGTDASFAPASLSFVAKTSGPQDVLVEFAWPPSDRAAQTSLERAAENGADWPLPLGVVFEIRDDHQAVAFNSLRATVLSVVDYRAHGLGNEGRESLGFVIGRCSLTKGGTYSLSVWVVDGPAPLMIAGPRLRISRAF